MKQPLKDAFKKNYFIRDPCNYGRIILNPDVLSDFYKTIRQGNREKFYEYINYLSKFYQYQDKISDSIYIKYAKYSIKYNSKFTERLIDNYISKMNNEYYRDGYILDYNLLFMFIKKAIKYKNYKIIDYFRYHYLRYHNYYGHSSKYYTNKKENSYYLYTINIKYFDRNINNLICLFYHHDLTAILNKI